MNRLPDTPPDPLVTWMERGERVRMRLEKLTHGSAVQFVDNLCQQFLRDNDKDRLETFSSKLGELRKSVYGYQEEVLLLDGWGKNYEKLEYIVKDIRTVLDWVDELWVLAMVDVTEVQQLHDKSELLYQKM
jgi:hypothetical protein